VVQPRPSASVILVRDGPAGLESFMVRRHARSLVAPSAFVFPGGTVRDDDLALLVQDPTALADAMSIRSDTPAAPSEAASLYVCALRELFEEAGILLVRDASGDLLRVEESENTLQERLESTRLTLQAHELNIGQVLAEHAWQPALDLLVPFSHWITPRSVAARFDTHFFVAELPPGQSALHDTIETSEGLWLSPTRALAPEYHTVYATAQHLHRLEPFTSVAALMEFARTKPIHVVTPELVEDAEGRHVIIRPEISENW
jgi:8-oxo-dGTP pyrophosphatase MutT (NUDIX family)